MKRLNVEKHHEPILIHQDCCSRATLVFDCNDGGSGAIVEISDGFDAVDEHRWREPETKREMRRIIAHLGNALAEQKIGTVEVEDEELFVGDLRDYPL